MDREPLIVVSGSIHTITCCARHAFRSPTTGCRRSSRRSRPAGCRVHRAGQVWNAPGIAVDAVDTTGSGDAFAAAFTVAW